MRTVVPMDGFCRCIAAHVQLRCNQLDVRGAHAQRCNQVDAPRADLMRLTCRTWSEWIKRYNLDHDYVMARCHGCRTVENLKNLVGFKDDQLEEGAKEFEGRISEIAIEAAETNGPGQIVALPGVVRLLSQLNQGRDQPGRRAGWAIVTSATSAYAFVGFKASRATVESTPPGAFVTGDSVSKGKPDPEPYLTGAKLLNPPADPKRCLVVEDAPPGIRAGVAAGARTLGLYTTHAEKLLWEAGADWVVPDLSNVSARWEGEGANARLFIRIEGSHLPRAQ